MNKSKLKYSDSHDHCLGIVGMAIALYAFDCGEYLVSLSLKEDQQDFVLTDDFVNFSSDFPDPSEALQNQLGHFKVYCGMIFSNYFCRRYCAHRTPNIDDIQLIEKHVCNKASTQMGIAEADAHQIAQEVQHSFRQLYSDNSLCTDARNLANDLLSKEEMLQDEVNDRLSSIFE